MSRAVDLGRVWEYNPGMQRAPISGKNVAGRRAFALGAKPAPLVAMRSHDLRMAIDRPAPDLAKIREALEAGANPLHPGPGQVTARELLTSRAPTPRGLEVAKLFNDYFPGFWEVADNYKTPVGVNDLPPAHELAAGVTTYVWVEFLAGAGLLDINRRSAYGTRPIHHAAAEVGREAYDSLRIAGAVDCPIELSRGELALLRLRGAQHPERWLGLTGLDLLGGWGGAKR